MIIDIGFDIELAVTAPTAIIYLLRVHPSRKHDLLAPEQFRITAGLAVNDYTDSFGNLCGRIKVPTGVSKVRISSRASVFDSGIPDQRDANARQHSPNELPTEVLEFLLPSRYCEVDSALLDFAWREFGRFPPGWQRVQGICDYVHQHICFDYSAARANRTAFEAWREQTGVCRDYAHLAVTLCRCMNIPARYVTGYLGDIGVPVTPPMDFSAWFEVYLGNRWHTFDARNNKPRIGRILMATGRDAGDVPITMTFGQNSLVSFNVIAQEAPVLAPVLVA